MANEEWLTIKGACERLQVSHMTIHRWMKSGKLTFYKFGHALRFKAEDLDDLANKTTSLSHASQSAAKCATCGNSEFAEGRLQGTGRLYFKPAKTKFWVFEESLIPAQAWMCTACGHIQLFADTEKLARLQPEQLPEDG